MRDFVFHHGGGVFVAAIFEIASQQEILIRLIHLLLEVGDSGLRRVYGVAQIVPEVLESARRFHQT